MLKEWWRTCGFSISEFTRTKGFNRAVQSVFSIREAQEGEKALYCADSPMLLVITQKDLIYLTHNSVFKFMIHLIDESSKPTFTVYSYRTIIIHYFSFP